VNDRVAILESRILELESSAIVRQTSPGKVLPMIFTSASDDCAMADHQSIEVRNRL
jgi:hypothetical protein